MKKLTSSVNKPASGVNKLVFGANEPVSDLNKTVSGKKYGLPNLAFKFRLNYL